MPSRVVGHRIGAILEADETERMIRLIGFGRYDGDFIPPKHIGGFNLGWPNPRLTLDNGWVVWGCECWWGPKDQITKMLLSYARSGWVIEQCGNNWRGTGDGGE